MPHGPRCWWESTGRGSRSWRPVSYTHLLRLRIEHAADAGSRLRAGKGVNVPDANLPISALTEKDLSDLSTVVELADLVEMSFVRDPSDVEQLLDVLSRSGGDSLGICLLYTSRCV